MSSLRAWCLRFTGLFDKERKDRELTEELESHLQMHIEDNVRAGMTPAEARRRALVKLGGLDQVKEKVRESRGIPWIESFWQDVRFGTRVLRKNLGFTTVAVLTLALGIGANTAIFSVADQVLLQNLPVAHPEQLVILRVPGDRPGHVSSDSEDATTFSYPMYQDLRGDASMFAGLLARFGIPLSVTSRGAPQPAKGELVSGNYFDVLGVTPALGRMFSSSDDTAPNANPVAVLSYGYWTERFGGDPGVLNAPLTVNGTLFTVVGVAPKGFVGVQVGRSTDVFIPITMKALMTPGWDGLAARNDSWLSMIGRLKPGFTRATAAVALAPIFHAIEESELPALGLSLGGERANKYLARPVQLLDGEHGRPILQANLQTPLLVLLTLVGLILLIACANLTSLLLARGEARQREMAVRLALGASRWRLVQQLLTESFQLAIAGGIAGVLLSAATLRASANTLTQQLGVSGLDLRLDLRVLLFAIAASALTALLFGLAPALRVTRSTLPDRLKSQSAAASAGASSVKLRKWLMVAQVALTATLLASAGYFTKSLANLEHQDLGVKLDHVVQFSVRPSLNHYTPQQTAALFDRIREAIAALPGVRSVSVAKYASFEQNDWASNVTVEGFVVQPGEDTEVLHNSVGPDYFSALSIPLVAGRDLRDSDSAANPKVAIISEKMAQRFFAGRNPLGNHMAWGGGDNVHPDIEIVGVVKNSKYEDLRDTIHPFAYLPYAQDTTLGAGTFYVRTSQDPASLGGTLRELVQRLDPNLPVFQLMTLQEEADRSVFVDRAVTAFAIGLGSLAALLAVVGLYGVMAYIVALRTKEIGIRMAIGATRQSAAWLILGEVMIMGGIGITIGLVCAFALSSLVQARLYGVRAGDPLIVVSSAALLAGIVVLAGYLPARRASKVDPIVALRYE